MSNSIDWDDLQPVMKIDDAEIRKGEFGELSICYLKLDKGHDTRPAFRGLPDDLCQIPHWGYIFSGKIRLWSRGDPQIFEAGKAFYWSPGHAPEAVEDTYYLELSPTEQYNALMAHLAGGTPTATEGN